MFVQSLNMRCFRNLTETRATFGKEINVIWGNNAQGKTNFIEALYLMGNGKSFRTSRNEDLIKKNEKKTEILAETHNKNVRHEIILTIEKDGKKFRKNGKDIQGIAELVDVNRQILFYPEDVGIAKNAPMGRRNLIDRAIFLLETDYLRQIQEYNRTVKQRNSLLKKGKGGEELQPWNESLIDKAAGVRCRRQKFIREFRPYLREAYGHMSAQKEEADIFLPDPAETVEEATLSLRHDLQKMEAQEARFGTTLVGPHRDDPRLTVNGFDLRRFGSQGQQRSFILAVKAALVFYLEERLCATPVLLLDDISSELDNRRKKLFFNYLLKKAGQIFITTTDPQSLVDIGLGEATYFRVDEGRIYPGQR